MKTVTIRGKNRSSNIYTLPCSFFPFTSALCDERKNYYNNLVRDPTLKVRKCCQGVFCPLTRVCSKPDIKLCAIGLSKDGLDPVIDIKWGHEPPNYICTYDSNKIDTVEQISKYHPSKLRQIQFCSQPSNVCSKGAGPVCSKLLSLDKDGLYCRNLVAQDDTLRNEIIDEYCLHNPSNYDCKCVNRSNYTDYNQSKLTHPIPDSCWYKPCNAENILNKEKPENCPINMCNIILDAHDDKDVAINNNSINCNFSKNKDDSKNYNEIYDYIPLTIMISTCLIIIIMSV